MHKHKIQKGFEWQVQKLQLLQLIESQKQQMLKFVEQHNQRMTELELGLLEVYKVEEQLVRQAKDSQMDNNELFAQITQLVRENAEKYGKQGEGEASELERIGTNNGVAF